ncbi:MAG: molybdenum cofactor guanylyltransferase [Ilumatobacteraceae bacterium]|nr:molybdenum cofactor guanylyltransferase [Ilumatobacteraceae bacterium]
MGVDKATLAIDGVAMARRVADALAAAGCSPLVAVGGDQRGLSALHLDLVDDRFPGEGPLGGILTALALGAPAVVLACDLPDITAATIVMLVDAVGDHDAAIAYSDHAEPLCAVWSSAAAALLEARFDTGERALHRAIECLDIAWVTVPPAELRNVNTPADLRSL